MTKTLREVYEQYKHMDKTLSDARLVGNLVQAQILFEVWQAIKAQIAAGDMSRELGDPCTINEQLR